MTAGVAAGTTANSTKTSAPSRLVLPGGRSAGVVAFEEEVVAFFLNAADLLGVPKSVAAIYGTVFASPAPLSFADIEARLDLSSGSISQGLRVLREVGALKEISSDTDRAELFTPDLEMRKLVGQFLENRLRKQLDAGASRLADLKRSLPDDRAAGGEILQRRLASLQEWHRKTRALLPIAKTFLRLP